MEINGGSRSDQAIAEKYPGFFHFPLYGRKSFLYNKKKTLWKERGVSWKKEFPFSAVPHASY